jgi:hypothetical protein
MNTRKLTSVKIEESLFETFKEKCSEDNFTFQKLAERSIYLYLTDPEFKKRVTDLVNVTLPR